MALKNQIIRNYASQDLENNIQKLDKVIHQGKKKLIDNYAFRLQNALSLSDYDTKEICSNLDNLIEQRHKNIMDTTDQRLSVCREEALSGDAPMPNLNRDLFQSIYDVILDSFNKNNGDALSAIRDGVTYLIGIAFFV